LVNQEIILADYLVIQKYMLEEIDKALEVITTQGPYFGMKLRNFPAVMHWICLNI
jgi:hypothetical protein